MIAAEAGNSPHRSSEGLCEHLDDCGGVNGGIEEVVDVGIAIFEVHFKFDIR